MLKPITWATTRVVGCALFPVCSTIDLAVLATKQVKEIPHILIGNDPAHVAQFRKNQEALKKTTLGLITSPASILSPDIVTQHFIPGKLTKDEVTPYGKLYSAKAHIAYPKSIEEIQEIIYEAKQSGKSISIAGKCMSQGKQVISNQDWNIVINTSLLNHIKIDGKLAHVGAGVTWQELQREANEHGLAVRVMQASNIFSIGGSISVNCHGWDHKTGSLRNTIHALTIVDAKGEVVHLTPSDPLFDYVVGGYGGFGVIVEATLSLTDNLRLMERGVEISPKDYVAYFNQNIRDNDNIDMHLYRLSLEPGRLFRTGVAVNYHRVNNVQVVADLIDEPERGTRMDRIKIHTVRRLPWLRDVAWKVEKKNALLEKVSTRNEIMRPPINPIFNNSKVDTEWLQEYFVKGEELPGFLKQLGRILQQNKVALLNASVRFVKADPKTKLSYASDADHFAVVLFFNQTLSSKEIQKTKLWVQEVIDYLIAHNGTYYLPYQHFATKEQFQACYPNGKSSETLFSNGFYEDYLTSDEDSLFRKVFSQDRDGVRDFLNNIFLQLKEKEFLALVDTILENPKLTDNQIYAILYKNISQAQPNALSKLMKINQSLNSLKKDLGNQTATLLNKKSVNGYVEIGYPGRMMRPLQKRLNMKGPFYAITEQERVSDYIEAGFPRPYDRFIPLNDYEPISVPAESVDLVCLYIGLHHAPEDKIDPFLASIYRILRPGGSFILMDHDAGTQKMQDLADVVHSIFNAATGVSPKENRQEIRNFQSLQYWIDRVESNQLAHYPHKPLIRDGDSTLNSLIRFDKPRVLTLDPKYCRDQKQTYLTAPEWQNVRAAQRYAAFVEQKPSFDYPFFKEIGGFWQVYGQSWQAARKQNSAADVALSEYNMMNLFVGTSMTLEYGLKGLVSLPFAVLDKVSFGLMRTKNETEKERVRSLKEYGNYIETTPFYQYHYFKDIGSYWSCYLRNNRSPASLLKGFVLGSAMTVEYTLKGIVSAPMALVYGSDALKEAQTIHLLIQDPENRIEAIDPRIVVLETFPEHNVKHIEMPRYMQFTEIMLKIAHESDITCLNIAGHNKIQIDVRAPKRGLKIQEGARKLYNIPAPTDKRNAYVALEVETEKLLATLRNLERDEIKVLFIHDF